MTTKTTLSTLLALLLALPLIAIKTTDCKGLLFIR